MDTKQLITDHLGGRSAVKAETGLSKGRISQWCSENHIPDSWLRYFKQKYKKLPWHEYTRSKDQSH